MQIETFRRMSAERKLELACQLRQTNIELLRSGILAREGPMDAETLRLRVLRRILPEPLFRKAYPQGR